MRSAGACDTTTAGDEGLELLAAAATATEEPLQHQMVSSAVEPRPSHPLLASSLAQPPFALRLPTAPPASPHQPLRLPQAHLPNGPISPPAPPPSRQSDGVREAGLLHQRLGKRGSAEAGMEGRLRELAAHNESLRAQLDRTSASVIQPTPSLLRTDAAGLPLGLQLPTFPAGGPPAFPGHFPGFPPVSAAHFGLLGGHGSPFHLPRPSPLFLYSQALAGVADGSLQPPPPPPAQQLPPMPQPTGPPLQAPPVTMSAALPTAPPPEPPAARPVHAAPSSAFEPPATKKPALSASPTDSSSPDSTLLDLSAGGSGCATASESKNHLRHKLLERAARVKAEEPGGGQAPSSVRAVLSTLSVALGDTDSTSQASTEGSTTESTANESSHGSSAGGPSSGSSDGQASPTGPVSPRQVLASRHLNTGGTGKRSALATLDPERYSERRRRNNEAAKRCRANRRMLYEYRFKRAEELEQENGRLKEEMAALGAELAQLKGLLAQTPLPNPALRPAMP